MSVKFTLTPNPTFKAPVEIPMPDGRVAKPVFEFKHRTKDALDSLVKNTKIKDPDLLKEILTGWDLDDEFNDANIEALCSNFVMAPRAILNVYITALVEGRRGN
jgi:hypothetical protein